MSNYPLISELDPDRDYGDRSYEEVVDDVKSSRLAIEPGQRLPVLRDATTRRPVKGTGQPLQNESPHEFSRKRVREWMADNLEDFLEAMRKGAIEDRDPRWAKLALEYGISKPIEVREFDKSPLLGLLMEKLSEPYAAHVSDLTVEGRAREL